MVAGLQAGMADGIPGLLSGDPDPLQPVAPAFALAGAGSVGFAVHSVEGDDALYAGLRAGSGLARLSEIPSETFNDVLQQYCVVCHNDQLMTGNFSVQGFDVGRAPEEADKAEKMIVKLRAGMMPPPGMPRPEGDTLLALVMDLEQRVDQAAALSPNPGSRYFQRLNHADYQQSIHELLDLRIDASQFLPPDQRSANFDNIADAQMISPTLVTSYLNAAASISRLAVGDQRASPRQVTYNIPAYASQRERVEGAPFGSRGGTSVLHFFPADGEYVFRVGFAHTITGSLFGEKERDEQVEISINGERVALLDVDRWMHEQEAMGVYMQTEPIGVRAGQHRVSAVFVKRAEGPIDDLTSPHDWSLADRHIGEGGYGIETLPHLKDLIIGGPYNVTGISETATRRRIFTCRPTSAAERRPCAEEILGRLADQAFRGFLDASDLEGLMALYEQGEADAGFEAGIQLALQGILASPKFIFRMEPGAVAGTSDQPVPLSDLALASRLSFFLWNLPPDQELREVAREGRLNTPEELERQVRRMLQDRRSEALATRFAAQWLRLHDLDEVNPDAFWFPDFNQQLKDAMRRETELFFLSLVQEDRSLLDLLTADYTFVNEQLARHYGMTGVVGSHFRRVPVQHEYRNGLLGHGSILTATSFGNRTSVVDRGKWVLEVLLGTPPPAPPANVPPLEENEGVADGAVLTSKAQLEMHTANPVCAACHKFMDPIGLALEQFDPTGRWRITERRGMGGVAIPLDTRGQFWDGRPVESPQQLREVLVGLPIPLVRNFTNNLMTYAIGRRTEYFDQPAVRAIEARARAGDYRMTEFIVGVVQSEPFRMVRHQAVADDANRTER
jgi:hypothetical protein